MTGARGRRVANRGSCRYGSLGLLGCLLAIALPDAASAQVLSCSISVPTAVAQGTSATYTANCSPGATAYFWSSCIASCTPTNQQATVCTFPFPVSGPAFYNASISVSAFNG